MMPILENDTFLRALNREPTPWTPVWLMRQAGRYLPEYNVTRAKAGSFLALAQTPSLATEVTLQPLDRYPLDAAILFSDILTVPDAMGLGLAFAEGEGPRFARTTADEAAIRGLEVPDMGKLRYVFDAVRDIKRALRGRVPLIGFAGSPFTLACYMIEGGGSADFAAVRRMACARPDLLHRLVGVNAQAVAAYLNEQIAAGADAVMMFDTWGGLLTANAYRSFSLASDARGPRASAAWARWATGADDRVYQRRRSMAGRHRARAARPPWVSIGRPILRMHAGELARRSRCKVISTRLCCSPTRTLSAAKLCAVVRAAGPAPGHIFNLGHGIVPTTPPENVAALVDAVHRESRLTRAAA